MSTQATRTGAVRKIVTMQNMEDMVFLKEAISASGGHIIKELPLIQGYLCEFPGEGNVSLTVRGYEDKFKVEEDLEFRLCCLATLFKPFYQPYYQQPQLPQPKPQPFPIHSGKRVDWGLKRIGAPKVWGKLKDRRVRVGIIDTGISLDHPDLQPNIKEGVSTLEGVTSFRDDYGHGTHAAGIIAACNSNGMVGINPYTDLYIVKAFDKNGNGKLSDIIEGIDWLMRRQVKVINMSFSTSDANDSFQRVMNSAYQKGILLVAAAGNDGKDVNFPARFSSVVAVSATDNSDNIASFSSYGPEIAFCAPGVNINSTWLKGYAVKSGTSFSAPHIAGTASALLNYYGMMPPGQIKEIMSQGAVNLTNLSAEQQGAGLVEIPRIIR